MRAAALLLLSLWLLAGAAAQSEAPARADVQEEFKVYTEHPRLFLPPRRLRLLRRERERASPRWQQFDALISGRAHMPEPALAWALHYAVSETEEYGRLAANWAAGPGTDLRQIALVFDWCQALLSEAQAKAILAKLRRGLAELQNARDLAAVRTAALAAIVQAGHGEDSTERRMRWTVLEWWRKDLIPALRAGKTHLPLRDHLALLELMHAVRDNLTIDLRDDFPKFFQILPAIRMLSYYPSSFPAAENEYRIPMYEGAGEPDLSEASLARATDFLIVAFDTNALENQFLQGWLINDRFLMRGPMGSVYELLWANPYQPGLSYYHMPLVQHDANGGRLWIRSSWEEDATWLHFAGGPRPVVQLFQDGARKEVRLGSRQTIRVGESTVMVATSPMRFTLNHDSVETMFLIGLKPRAAYEVEVDDEEMVEYTTDAGGILALTFPASANVGVRLQQAPAGRSPSE